MTKTRLPDSFFTTARAAWPGIEVSRDAFEAWAGPRMAGATEGDEQDLERAKELYLCCACAAGDDRAIAAFDRVYFRDIGPAVGRLGPSTLPDDVKAELRARLFVGGGEGSEARARIADFSGRGGLGRWVRAIAVRTALNLVRAKKDKPHDTLEDELLGNPMASDDPELAHMKELYREEWREAFGAALASMEPESQNFLRLHHVDGLSLGEIGALYHVSVPTASRRVAKARDELMARTRGELKKRLKVDGDELESILRLIQSRLTIGPLRKAKPDPDP